MIAEAANIAMAGMDPMEFLTAEEPTKVIVMQAISAKHAELWNKREGRS